LDTDGVRRGRYWCTRETDGIVRFFRILRKVWEVGGFRLLLLPLTPTERHFRRLNTDSVRRGKCRRCRLGDRIIWFFWKFGEFRVFREIWKIGGFGLILTLAPAERHFGRLDADGIGRCEYRWRRLGYRIVWLFWKFWKLWVFREVREISW
jgi:hypothetical protein